MCPEDVLIQSAGTQTLSVDRGGFEHFGIVHRAWTEECNDTDFGKKIGAYREMTFVHGLWTEE
ncbi:hypothetical protein J6590_061925 [Homalodisca vitripennis]|nr:hypothetical protein J6590_091208 [Homalodisca vitripennis]KAG8330525.1 hypothetical protein J6590_061925 [Homalodisca vitripennis]